MYSSLLLGLALSVGAPAVKEAPKKEAPSIVGEWIVERYVRDGKENEKRKGMHFSVKDGQIFVQEEGGKGIDYKVDPKANPPTLDLAAEEIKGIYKIEGDTLTICFPKGGKADRPKKFESTEGSELVLMILKREKK